MKRKTISSNKPIHITKRDKTLLETIREYGLVSTEHVRHLLFPSFSRARKRLRQLWQHGLLVRLDRPTKIGEGTKMKLYRISRKGERLLTSDDKKAANVNRARPVSSSYAEHLLAINRFRVCMNLAARKTDGVSLSDWMSDRQSVLRVSVQNGRGQLRMTLVPDGAFSLLADRLVYRYFLEVDRGSVSISRMRMKLLGYHDLYVNSRCRHDQTRVGFRVLIVTDTERRLKRIVETIQGFSTNFRRPDVFLLADSMNFSYYAPERVLGPIWTVVSADRKVAHSQPLIPSIRSSRQCQVNHQCTGMNPAHGNGHSCSADKVKPILPGAGAETTR